MRPHASQLCQRPFNRDCKKPNCNQDFISPMFRDYVMPARCARRPSRAQLHSLVLRKALQDT